MYINKNGFNKITGGRCAGDEIRVKTLLWSDVLFMAANLVGLGVLVWIFWPLF